MNYGQCYFGVYMKQKNEPKKLHAIVEAYSESVQEELHEAASITAYFLAEEEAAKPHQFHSKKSQIKHLEKKIDGEFEILQRRLTSGSSQFINNSCYAHAINFFL